MMIFVLRMACVLKYTYIYLSQRHHKTERKKSAVSKYYLILITSDILIFETFKYWTCEKRNSLLLIYKKLTNNKEKGQ